MKKEYLVLGVIILSLAGYLLFHSTDRTHFQLPQPAVISKADISKIEVAPPRGEPVVIKKAGDEWQIMPEKYPADQDRINEMLGTLEKLTITDLVSESGNVVRYDLQEEKRIRVTAWRGNDIVRRFDIGKTAPSYRHTYIRLQGDDNVYLADASFRRSFDATKDDFRDKEVFKLDKSAVDALTLTDAGETIRIVRTEAADEKKNDVSSPSTRSGKGWQTEDGTGINAEKIDRMLSSLSDLDCSRYLYDTKKEDLGKPVYRVEVDNGQTLTVYAKKDSTDSAYPAASSMNSYLFLLPDWEAENIMIPISDLKATEQDKKS